MAQKPGHYLKIGDTLNSGDWMRSGNGAFFVALLDDGNLITGRGAGPDDPNTLLWATNKYVNNPPDKFNCFIQNDGNIIVIRVNPHELIWASNKYGPAGDFFLIIQDDGNLVAYRGTDPSNTQGVWWACNKYDPVQNFEIEHIDYDVANAHIISDAPSTLDSVYLSNSLSTTQSTTVSNTKSTSDTHSWSDSLGINVGISTSFSTGIPILAEGKVSVSLTVSTNFTWSGSTTTTTSYTWSVPITLPPQTAGMVLATIFEGTLLVPFVMTGTTVFASGLRLNNQQVRGVYTGTNSHNLQVVFTPAPLNQAQIVPSAHTPRITPASLLSSDEADVLAAAERRVRAYTNEPAA